VGSPDATMSPSLSLNEVIDIALDDTVPSVDPPTPVLSTPGVADHDVAQTVSLNAPAAGSGPLGPPGCRDSPAARDPVRPAGSPTGAAEATPMVLTFQPAVTAYSHDAGVHIPAWLETLEVDSQLSGSSDNGRLFAPGAAPSVHGSSPLAARPVLSLRNLVSIARNAYGRGQAGQLVPALLSGFETDLSYSDLHERLRLLWLMRRDVVTLVWAIIIVGQARCKPPWDILWELLEMAQQYATYTN